VILLEQAKYVVRAADRVEQDVDVLIDGSRISRIGSIDRRTLPEDTIVVSCRGRAVIPGLINAHTHLYQSLLKGRRDDLPLVEWCERVTFPFVRAVLDRAWRAGDTEIGAMWSALATIEMLRGGITTFVDMDMNLDGVIRTWLELGIRGVAAMTMVDQWVPPEMMLSPEATREETLSLIETWHRVPSPDPLITVFLGPSAPFTCSPALLRWITDQAKRFDLGIQIHVSETAWEVDHSLETTGMTPLDYLASEGLLERPVTAVHAVHLTEEEIQLAADRDVVIVHNPKSNMKLGSGIAPIGAMRSAGIPVALGTDGAASNDLLDLFEEMRTAALLQKVATEDPTALGACDVFRFATEFGALACRIDAGRLDEGKLADCVVIDLGGAHLFRLTDEIVPALVYCAKTSDVETVIVNGRIVVRDRVLQTGDERTLLNEIKRVGNRYV